VSAPTKEPAGSILTLDAFDGGVRVSGQVDLSNAGRFREAVMTAAGGASLLTLDLQDCTYMGSEGLGVLIEAVKELGDGRLVLRSPSGILMKVLDIAGLSKLPNVEIAAG
jgi:anti-anti-sigma factor